VIYGSVCSGIEAATVAWHSLGWEPAFFSEIEAFPREVLSHHYPEVPLHGDFTTIETNQYGTIDLLVGGTPCQSFSIAGLRKGLDDDRGNLALEFLKLAQRERPKWLVWENVPGVLSSNGGRDFGTFLGGLGELGYGFAYRVLDAQYFGVAQRRRRVFVVGYLGDWRSAAAVLFERESLSGNPAPSRQKGQGVAKTLTSSTRGGGANINRELVTWPADIAATMNARFSDKMGLEDQHALGGASYFVPDTLGTMTARMFNALGARDVEEGAIIPFSAYNQQVSDVAQTVASRSDMDTTSCITTSSMAVRRLTPIECERLQGFPDNYTQIPYRNKPVENCPDGPRYKALGNSMAVLVMHWIGRRIEQVDKL
jgi:DNA (cytosine-5)-methyltransferase 1